MDPWQLLLLGFLQGLTEFLPISSTAHLRIVPALLGWKDPGAAVTAILQLGSLLALLVFFWKECLALVRAGFRKRSPTSSPSSSPRTLLWAIVVGTLPIAVLGFLGQGWIRSAFRSLWVVAASLILVALFLWLAEQKARLGRGEEEILVSDGLWVGVAQALALIPGVSRSGSCLAAGLFLGFRREVAARFAFLLGIPALLAAGVHELWQIEADLSAWSWVSLGVATAASFASSYLTIEGLLRFLKSRTVFAFVVYRLFLGAMLVFLLWQGVLSPAG